MKTGQGFKLVLTSNSQCLIKADTLFETVSEGLNLLKTAHLKHLTFFF